MPLYTYKCESCGESFEILQSLHDADNPECRSCGSSDVKREVSRPAPPVIKKSADTCCGSRSGCENPKRCCERQ